MPCMAPASSTSMPRRSSRRRWPARARAEHGADLLRVKGVLNLQGVAGPVAVHGVHHVFHPPVELAGWPDADRRSRLVIIARDLDPDALARDAGAAGL